MKFLKLVPNIFYEDIKVGRDFFIECLEFKLGFNDFNAETPCCIVQKDNVAFFLFQSKEHADRDRPEFRLHTDDINEVYNKVSATHPKLLHPNLNKPTLRPWGAQEFALVDPSGVCMIIQQW